MKGVHNILLSATTLLNCAALLLFLAVLPLPNHPLNATLTEAVTPTTMRREEDEGRGRDLGGDLESGLDDTRQGCVIVPGLYSIG